MSFGKQLGQFFVIGFGMVGGIMLTRSLMSSAFGGTYDRDNNFHPNQTQEEYDNQYQQNQNYGQ